MAMNSLPRGSWLHCFLHQTIVVSLTTLGPWWAWTRPSCVLFRYGILGKWVFILFVFKISEFQGVEGHTVPHSQSPTLYRTHNGRCFSYSSMTQNNNNPHRKICDRWVYLYLAFKCHPYVYVYLGKLTSLIRLMCTLVVVFTLYCTKCMWSWCDWPDC